MTSRDETLGRRLEIARLRSRLQKTEVAQSLGITRQTVANHERDETAPEPDILTRYAELYRTTVDALRGAVPVEALRVSGETLFAALSGAESAIRTLRLLLENAYGAERRAPLEDEDLGDFTSPRGRSAAEG